MEEALRVAPQDPRLWSDLAAARLDRAEREKDPFDLVLALAASDRALAATPSLPEAHFNRALALERLFLLEEARSAWKGYLQIDPSSDWAGEARERLRAMPRTHGFEVDKLRQQLSRRDLKDEEIAGIVRRIPRDARRYVEELLFGDWAESSRQGHSERAARTLDSARRIARSLAALKGEHLPEDAISVIDQAAGHPPRLAALAEGHLAYREARRLHAERGFSDARPWFEKARRSLAVGQSPAEALASVYLAAGQIHEQRFGEVVEVLEGTAGWGGSDRYPGMLGTLYWTLGLAHLGHGEPGAALAAYQKALAIFQRSGGVEDLAGVHAVLVELYRYLGSPREEWRHLHAALAATPEIRGQRLDAILAEAADACETAERPEAALYFQNARVTAAAADPVALSHALLRRSQTLLRLGVRAAAGRDLAEARKLSERIEEEGQRERIEADLLIAESEVEPLGALEDLDRALAFYQERQNHFYLHRLYLARARARLIARDETGAEEDLRSAIEEHESLRRRVSEESLQISLFEQANSAFDEIVRLLAARPDGAEPAFDFAERERARALLDRLGPLTGEAQERVLAENVEPLSSRQIQKELPDGVAVVEYAWLADRPLAWVVRWDRVALIRIPYRTSEIKAQVEDLRDRMQGAAPAAQLNPSLEALHSMLIRPVLPELRPRDRIVFIPDGSLHAVPFAALRDRSRGRFLVQDRTFSVAPSATFFLSALARDLFLASGRRPTAFAIGNPSFSRSLAPTLLPLPYAEGEALTLASLLPGSEVRVRAKATRRDLLEIAGRHEIVHFGGHATVNPEAPLFSHLLMAPEGESDSGLLYAHQLYGTRFERTRLAVLAACDTARGPVKGEGVLSLARAFLASGVPGVIASPWAVDDDSTARLFRIFYPRLRDGDDAALALRKAQLALLADPDPALNSPAAWAPFALLGAWPSWRPDGQPTRK